MDKWSLGQVIRVLRDFGFLPEDEDEPFSEETKQRIGGLWQELNNPGEAKSPAG
jgi:hypothetical protein